MNKPTRDRQSKELAKRPVTDFHKEFRLFAVAAETSRMAVIFTEAQATGNPLAFANDSFLALTGFSRDGILGIRLAFLLADITDRDTFSEIERSLEAGADGTWQAQCRRIDGSKFLATIFLSPVRDHQNIIRHYFLSFIEWGGYVERTAPQRKELHALYQNAPGFVAASEGADHRFSFANASYERLVGRKQLIGFTVAEVLPEIAEQGFIALLDQVYATGEPFIGKNLPIRLRGADNQETERFIDFVYQPVRDAKDRITGLFCEGYDVTEQKIAMDQIQTLQSEIIYLTRVSAMETMATTLAHELNQPLTTIVSFTAGARRLIESNDTSSGELLEVLELIGESSQRAGDIIRHLRSMTTRGKQSREVFDLQDLILKSRKLLKLAGCEDIDIVDESAAGIAVEADPIQIQQVLINLLRNACEATVEAGNNLVRIATSAADGTVVVSITDSGTGVPSEVALAGFRWTPTAKDTGMGVGLSISRTIIDAHGGELWIQSSGPEGSCFAFSLPQS